MAKTKAKPAAPKAKASAAPAKTSPAKAKAKPAAKKAKAAPAAAVPSPPAEGPWSMPRPAFAIQGYAFGMAYPSTLFHCAIPPTTREQRAELAARFEALLAGAKGLHRLDPFEDPAQGSERGDTAQWLCALAGRLQQLANLPVYASPRPVARGPHAMSLLVPSLTRGVQATSDLLKLMCTAFAQPDLRALKALREQANTAFAALKKSALSTSNTPRLVKAAIDNNIAFQELPASMIIYGIGKKSALMDSTFTHECSNVGARLAKYKHMSTAYLRRAGLPAPSNGIALSEDQALDIAHKLGFPVVVKPADKDGGIAVQADLRTDEEVRWAYEGVRKVTSMALVEKFYEGRDYRIVVFRGKAIWAKERQPAGVTGDGKSTIQELAERVNTDPRRGSDVYAPLKKIVLDDDAERLLARDGLSADSIPKNGEFVRLRRRANVSAGGTPIAVTDRMHPDNARVAERAADLLGLDLAGVDLIIPDIAQSWRDVPAAICEVNAQPELGGDAEHLYPQVLKALVRGSGHIPTVAVLGGSKAQDVAARIVAALSAQGLCVGSHDRAGVHVGAETVLSGALETLRAGRILTMDRRVETIVLSTLDIDILRQGLPVQQIDLLLLTGEAPPEPPLAQGNGRRLLVEAFRLIAPHCRAVMALATPDEFDPDLRAAVKQALRLNRVLTGKERTPFLRNLVGGIVTAVRKSAAEPAG